MKSCLLAFLAAFRNNNSSQQENLANQYVLSG